MTAQELCFWLIFSLAVETLDKWFDRQCFWLALTSVPPSLIFCWCVLEASTVSVNILEEYCGYWWLQLFYPSCLTSNGQSLIEWSPEPPLLLRIRQCLWSNSHSHCITLAFDGAKTTFYHSFSLLSFLLSSPNRFFYEVIPATIYGIKVKDKFLVPGSEPESWSRLQNA